MTASERYKDTLACLCRQSAFCQALSDRMQAGEAVDPDDVNEELELLQYAKQQFLQEKEQLGLTDGLEFMEDTAFFGFSFQKGRLEGDTSKLMDIVSPWIMKEEDNYRYEVGVLLLFHYTELNALYNGDKTAQKGRIRHGFLADFGTQIANKCKETWNKVLKYRKGKN